MTTKETLTAEAAELGIEIRKSWTNTKISDLIDSQKKVILHQCKQIIETAEKHRNCYFWSSPSSASQRRRAEFSNSYAFSYAGDTYHVTQSLQCTCKNTYFVQDVQKNGKTTTITVIKTVLKKLGA